MSSTFKVEVVPIKLQEHPNADKLSIVNVFDYPVVVATEDWKDKTLGAYIAPDSLVSVNNPTFSFLANGSLYDEMSVKSPNGVYARITVRRFRGILSYGLLVPLYGLDTVNLGDGKPFLKEGDEIANLLGVIHYSPPEPEEKPQRGPNIPNTPQVAGPDLFVPRYGVEAFMRYARMIFTPGEPVVATEKIHGANGRFVFSDGEHFIGSRSQWKRQYDDNGVESIWWRAAKPIFKWLQNNPDTIVFGEVYGAVQNLNYGVPKGEVRLAVFDIMKNGRYLSFSEALELGRELPWVPTVGYDDRYVIPYDFDLLVSLAEGQSLMPGANHYREGIAVKPILERHNEYIGRTPLKIVSPSYLEQK